MVVTIGTRINNYMYLCIWCLKLWVRVPFMAVYSIQHYVIKFVSDFWQVGGFPHQYNREKVSLMLVFLLVSEFHQMYYIFSINTPMLYLYQNWVLNVRLSFSFWNLPLLQFVKFDLIFFSYCSVLIHNLALSFFIHLVFDKSK